MESNNEAESYEASENITRRKLIGAVATSVPVFGAGCLGDIGGSEEEPTVAPPPGYTENETQTGTETQRVSDTDSVTEEELTENSTTEENMSETEQTATTTDTVFEVENPNDFNWETRDSLEETTGFCYIEEGYAGAIDAEEVESVLEEEHLYGEDPNNALNDGELIGAVDPLKPVEGNYAIDVDARHGDEINFYVQLVGEQDGGVYLNRQGAYEVSELEWAEVFNEC